MVHKVEGIPRPNARCLLDRRRVNAPGDFFLLDGNELLIIEKES